MANEKRLIDANEAIEKINCLCVNGNENWIGTDNQSFVDHADVIDILSDMPTVDAVEVKCKVGDWVYALWEAPVKQKYIIYCAEVKEIRIGMRNCRLTTTYRLEPIMYRGHIHEYRDEDFGKLVFPSEKEAEAALAKMDGDGNG